jgi:predicted lactoylglutathione lyase
MATYTDESTAYAPSTQQLVLEIYCSSVSTSIEFYTSLGFHLNWEVPDYFAQLSWKDGCLLFLKAKQDDETSAPQSSAGNLRVMVEDVDQMYDKCSQLGYRISQDIGDRKFVLRDFIVLDPDGFGLRFGSFLPGSGREDQNGPDNEIVIRHD